MSLTDFENSIKTYIKKRLEEEYPELFIESGTVISDLFINPMVSVLKPVIDKLNRVDLTQDLTNAALMTTDELDKIGYNNYGVSREGGVKASNYVYVEMASQYVGTSPEEELNPVIIGPITVSRSDGSRYSSNTTTLIKISDNTVIGISGTIAPGYAADYFNPVTLSYEFPVFVEAEAEGSLYNADVGDIDILITNYPLLTGRVFNTQAFSNGNSSEDNISYAERLRSGFSARQLGSEGGYKYYVKNNFKDVTDVLVAGYQDALMERDKIIVRSSGAFTEVHTGGKVDIYVKGESYDTISQLSYLKSDRIRVAVPPLANEVYIKVTNVTNPDNMGLTFNIIYEYPETKLGFVDIQVIAGPGGSLPRTGDEIAIEYQTPLSGIYGNFMWVTQTLFYNSNNIRILNPPLGEVISIENETTGNTLIVLDNSFVENITLPIVERGTLTDQSAMALNQILLSPLVSIQIPNYYVGHTIYIVSGSGAGQRWTILSYDKDTSICVLDTNLVTTLDTSSVYEIKAPISTLTNSAKEAVNLEINMDTLQEAQLFFSTGDLLKVSYTYNKLVQDIQKDLSDGDKRIITTDVLIFEATKKYIYLALQMKCKKGRTLTNIEKLAVQVVIERILSTTNFNSELQLSDVISSLYRDSDVSSFMDFVSFPCVFFSSSSVLDIQSDADLINIQGEEYYNSTIPLEGAETPILGKLALGVL